MPGVIRPAMRLAVPGLRNVPSEQVSTGDVGCLQFLQSLQDLARELGVVAVGGETRDDMALPDKALGTFADMSFGGFELTLAAIHASSSTAFLTRRRLNVGSRKRCHAPNHTNHCGFADTGTAGKRDVSRLIRASNRLKISHASWKRTFLPSLR